VVVARVDIRLLGRFEVRVGGRLVDAFESDSVREVVARVVADPACRPVPRVELAELLWPDRPQGAALGNLRHALAVLRGAIGDRDADRPVILVTPGDLRLDRAADVLVDTHELARVAAVPASSPGAVDSWAAAVSLRRGPFLDGLEPGAGPEWEEWLVRMRAWFDTQVLEPLRALALLRERTGEVVAAADLAARWTQLDPWDERAHRLMARALADQGRGAAALAYLDGVVGRLRSELDTAPTTDTLELLDRLRAGSGSGSHRPPVPVARIARVQRPGLRFADRTVELARLDRRLHDAVAGRGGVMLVAGEAGSGKSTLVEQFAATAADRMPRLVVVEGHGNAFTGGGDPLLPFRRILDHLCGDLEPAWTSGALTGPQADLVWDTVPAAATALVDAAPVLLGTLVDPAALRDRRRLRRASTRSHRPPQPAPSTPCDGSSRSSTTSASSSVGTPATTRCSSSSTTSTGPTAPASSCSPTSRARSGAPRSSSSARTARRSSRAPRGRRARRTLDSPSPHSWVGSAQRTPMP
jgi:DNA-binding SARP family transcriptional activator